MLACSLVTRTCFFKWDLTLAHWTQVSDRCPLGYLFIEERSEGEIMWKGIWYSSQFMPGCQLFRDIWLCADNCQTFLSIILNASQGVFIMISFILNKQIFSHCCQKRVHGSSTIRSKLKTSKSERVETWWIIINWLSKFLFLISLYVKTDRYIM